MWRARQALDGGREALRLHARQLRVRDRALERRGRQADGGGRSSTSRSAVAAGPRRSLSDGPASTFSSGMILYATRRRRGRRAHAEANAAQRSSITCRKRSTACHDHLCSSAEKRSVAA